MSSGKPEFNRVSAPAIFVHGRRLPATRLNAVTATVPLETIKHLLSDKPLRRPSRVKPSVG